MRGIIMSVKRFILLFSIASAFCFFFAVIYNVYAQSNTKNGFQSAKADSSGNHSKPVYTSRPKPSGAPAVIKDDAEAEALFAQA